MGVEYECMVCSSRLDTAHRCDSRNLQEKLATLGAALDQALQVQSFDNVYNVPYRNFCFMVMIQQVSVVSVQCK